MVGGVGERAVALLCSLLCLNPASGRRVCSVCTPFFFSFFFFGSGLGRVRSPRGEGARPASGQVDPLVCLVALFAVRI